MVQKFMNASMKGWRYAVMNKAETVDILLKAGGPTLERKHQEAMMDVIASLVLAGAGKTKGVGYTDRAAIAKEQEILLDLKALTGRSISTRRTIPRSGMRFPRRTRKSPDRESGFSMRQRDPCRPCISVIGWTRFRHLARLSI